MRRLVGALLATVLLTACGGAESEAGGGAEVSWDQYGPGVKDRIDSAADAENCNALQREFDTADANDERQRERTGEGNADLLDYIDNAMREAGCYG